MTTMELIALPLDQIVIPQGRDLNAEAVESIASSIKSSGLLSPISVLADDEGNFRLISGRHRIAAMRSLGMERIDARVYRGLSEIEVRLMEIIENLHRADLTVLERAEQTAEYVKLVKEKREQSAAQAGQDVSNVKGASGRERGDSAAARDLNIPRQEIQRSETIADLDSEAKEAAKAANLVNNQSALLKAAKAPKGKQAEVIKKIATEKTNKKRSGPRSGKDVNKTVKAILHDFGDADVRLIIDALTEGLARRAVDVTPEASAQGAEADQEVIDGCPTAPSDPDTDPDAEISWDEIERVIRRDELEELQNSEPDPEMVEMLDGMEIDELVLHFPPSATPDADGHGVVSA